MANIKLVGNNWEAEGIFDKIQNKTQKAINSEVVSKLGGIEEGAQVNRTYTATTGKPTANQTPSFGDTVTVSQVTQDTVGQISVTDRTIKIPNSIASTSAAGLMSAADKTALDAAVTNIGDMSNLETTATDLVGAANELKGSLGKIIDTYNTDITYYVGNYVIRSSDGKLYICTATTSGAFDTSKWSEVSNSAINDLKGSLNTVCLRAAVKTISANGTSSNTLTGLTADHVVGNWGMFSDAACTTPIPENSPTCDITITTAANAWSVTIANFSSTFYLRPTFILKQN